MEGESILTELIHNNQIAIIKINAPKKLNAISFEMFAQLEKSFEDLFTN